MRRNLGDVWPCRDEDVLEGSGLSHVHGLPLLQHEQSVEFLSRRFAT